MRRAIALPLAILAALFLAASCNTWAFEQNTARWRCQLQQAADALQAGDWSGAERTLKEGYEDWAAHRTYLCVVAVHDEINSAEESYVRARTLAAAREDSECLSELAGLLAQLQAMGDMERLSLRNIL